MFEKLIALLWPLPDFNDYRVKIVILDTSINATDTYIRGSGRILEYKNWAEPPNIPTTKGRRPFP